MKFMGQRHPRWAPHRCVDPAAMAALQRTYAACHTKTHPRWEHACTAPTAIALGRLYAQAWGRLPSVTRCRGTWCLPEYHAIQRLFGSLADYHAAIEAAEEEILCPPPAH